MKIKSQIWIDKYLVNPVVRLINPGVILLGRLLKIDHRLNKSFKIIAVCKYKGMGSILQSTPLLKTLRINYPDAKIIFISSEINRDILEKISEIDELILIDDSSFLLLLKGFFGFIRKLILRKIEVYIDLEVYSNFSNLVTILSMAKNRLGFYLTSKNYRMGNYTHMMYYNTRCAISETYLQFARLLKCDPLSKEIVHLESNVITIRLTKDEFFALSIEKYIVINSNASDLRIERRWDKHNFVRLIRMISGKYPKYKIFLVGSKNESGYVEDLIEKTGITENIYSLAGKTDISELISVIRFAAVLITNDSGPMHIAFSTKTNLIALFGPCSPQQYGGSTNTAVVYANLYCSPCIHEFIHPPCKGNNLCMKAITVEEVFTNFENILDKRTGTVNETPKEIKFSLNLSEQLNIAGTLYRKT